MKKALLDLGITLPVAVDNNFTSWRVFSNNYRPAHYFVDARDRIRFHHFDKDNYETSDEVIRTLPEAPSKECGSI